jgi:hypothetical protein
MMPLAIKSRYDGCGGKDVSVREVANIGWQLEFRRMLGEKEYNDLLMLENMMSDVQLTSEGDAISWGLTSSKTFTARFLYKFLANGGVSCNLSRKIWSCKFPLKIKKFLWQLFQNRLQNGHQLKERDWKGGEFCVLCGKSEDVEHLFFSCSLASFVWSFISESLGWNCDVSPLSKDG